MHLASSFLLWYVLMVTRCSLTLPRSWKHGEKCTRSRSIGFHKILLRVLDRPSMHGWWSKPRPHEKSVWWWGNFYLFEKAFPSLPWKFESYTQTLDGVLVLSIRNFYIKSRFVRYHLQLHPDIKWQQSKFTTSSRVVRYLEDAEKFIFSYRSIIEQAPLQT